jgi:hypothetical protein
MRAYLDNSIVSAIAKDDEPSESDAISRLLAAYDDNKIELVTSERTLKEIKKYMKGETLPKIERIFRLLEKVPIVSWDEFRYLKDLTDRPMIGGKLFYEDDAMYNELLKSGLKVLNVRHIFVAGLKSCNAFLTCDRNILDRTERIKVIRKIKYPVVQKPSHFVAAQEWLDEYR